MKVAEYFATIKEWLNVKYMIKKLKERAWVRAKLALLIYEWLSNKKIKKIIKKLRKKKNKTKNKNMWTWQLHNATNLRTE